MTMTIDLPSEIVDKVRSEALFRGLKLEAILLEKIQQGLSNKEDHSSARPWLKYFGALKGLHDERNEIESRIAEEFEQVNIEEWK